MDILHEILHLINITDMISKPNWSCLHNNINKSVERYANQINSSIYNSNVWNQYYKYTECVHYKPV